MFWHETHVYAWEVLEQNSSLQKISLYSNKIGDDGASALAKVPEQTGMPI